ncbi:MAG: glutathione peroxidase [Rhodoblastus sp.]
MTNVYDFTAKDIDGKDAPLDAWKGKALLIVNTASQCGFTPQYAGLEKLHRDLSDRGFEVLGFPCNQFGGQEPGDAEEIKKFCALKYDVSFPMFAKVDVNGSNTHPLFDYLKREKPGLLGSQGVKWNFTKFLIDKEGKPVARYAPTDSPESIRKDIEKLLG